MPVIDTPLPKLEITNEARPYVEDYYFNSPAYSEYALGRGIDESNLAKLKIVLTHEGVSPLAIANYSPMILGDPTICLSVLRTPRRTIGQNVILLHETEHFAWNCKHPIESKVRSGVKIGTVACTPVIGSVYFGTNFAEMYDFTVNPIQTLGASAMGITLGFATGAMLGVSLNKSLSYLHPDEIKANIVSKKEAKKHDPFISIRFY